MTRAGTALALVLLVACGDDGGLGTSGPGGGSPGATTSGPSSAANSASSSGTGGAGGVFVPDPIPEISDEVPEPCQAVIDEPWPPQFLYGGCGVKRMPSYDDRELACPVVDTSATIELTGGGTTTYVPSTEPAVFDSTALEGIVPADLHVVVMLVRRVNGAPPSSSKSSSGA